jgi:aryl-alcohol dehydrogenase-like predicted oxidoreductase
MDVYSERRLGDRGVGRVAYGAMWLSLEPDRPDPDAAIAVLHAALDAGVRLIDTADAYALDATELGHNERLVREGVRTWGGPRDAVVVATKGGHVRDSAGGWALDGSREYLLRSCARSMEALDAGTIDLYFLHRPDPARPLEESVTALADLQQRGWIRRVGLSNVDTDQLERARRIVRVDAVSNEFSPRYRASDDQIRWCERNAALFLAWRPLGGINERGAAYDAFHEIAAERGVSPQEVTAAWLARRSRCMLPLFGATRAATIRQTASATTLALSAGEVRRLDATRPTNRAS